MENLDIQPTGNTPLVRFNAETGKLLLKGRSIPEDPGEFYERVLHWLETYFSETDQETEMEFVLEYANSGSSKYVLEILKDLQKYSFAGKNIRIIWCYEEDDESIEELGEIYMNAVKVPFEMREIPEEEL
ncbi:MAG: DUF1987 domain-containing protein [Bacteroidales bacterium]|nr:DUF1987 domain-containing protein [Bacteroidales bacterium]